ncbi:helix-turn-helix domain-containing protein [Pseudomonadota bacterium]
MHKQLRDLLIKAGLKEMEAAVYVELLKNPAKRKWHIKERLNVDKNKIYRAFDELLSLKVIKKDGNFYKAISCAEIVGNLEAKEFKLRNLANRIKHIAPFLSLPDESIKEMHILYTPDQIREAYLNLAEQDYTTNLDFGDFENFVHVLGSIDLPREFRRERSRHASNRAFVTNSGPVTDYFSTNKSKIEYKTNIIKLNVTMKNRFIIFSDTSDYVMFNNFPSTESATSVLVKSRLIADAQREQFRVFSQLTEK